MADLKEAFNRTAVSRTLEIRDGGRVANGYRAQKGGRNNSLCPTAWWGSYGWQAIKTYFKRALREPECSQHKEAASQVTDMTVTLT